MAAAAAGQVLRLVAKGLSKLGKKGKAARRAMKKYPGKAKRKPGQTTQWRKDETVQDIPENDPLLSPAVRARAKKERLAREAKKGVAKIAKSKRKPPKIAAGGSGKPPRNGGGKGPLFREEGTSTYKKSLKGEDPNLLAGGDSPQRRIADKTEREAMVKGEPVGELQGNVPRPRRTSEKRVNQLRKDHAAAIKERKKWLKELKAITPKTTQGGNKVWKSPTAIKRYKELEGFLERNRNRIKKVEKDAGKGVIKKSYTGKKEGGIIMPKKMSRVGLSPAEESRSGTMSEAKRKKYAKGGKMQQGYDARKDEQLGMTRGKEAGKKMSMAGRRKVAKATRKPRGTYGFSGGGVIGAGAAMRGLGSGRRRT